MSNITAEDIGTEVLLVNQSGLPDEEVEKALQEQFQAEFSQVSRWVNNWGGSGLTNRRRNSTVFNQDRYTLPSGIFDQMMVAVDAARNDDVVSNAVEITEQLAFKRLNVECDDDDLSNVIEQVLKDMNIVEAMRKIWRELFIISQCYVAVEWRKKTFRVKAKRESGRPAKKVFRNIMVPHSLAILDPLKVIPMGDNLFGKEKLIYIADDDGEAADINESLARANSSDMKVKSMIKGRYEPTQREIGLVNDLVGHSRSLNVANRLFELDEDLVFRVHSTKPDYQRFADIRLTSVFELLDLKHNLRQSDRSDILGNLNCIVLVKRGSDKLPSKPEQIARMGQQLKSNARNQLLVTDHTVEVEIITKKFDHTLKGERWNALDSRITARLFQVLHTGAYNAGTAVDDSSKLFKVIAASMEARRDLIRDRLMTEVFIPMIDKNDWDTEDMEMTFHPRRIALDFDHNFSQKLFDLFLEGGISLETMLDELDISQEQEAYRLERENERYGDLFQPRATRKDTQQELDGRNMGGNNNNGGMTQKSFTTTPPNERKSGSPNTTTSEDKE